MCPINNKFIQQPECALEMKLINFKISRISSACLTTTIDLPSKLLGTWPHAFPGQSLFLSAQTFLSFVTLIFLSGKSVFLCSLINTRVPVVMPTHS